jgi:hypothetical protein
MSDRGERGPTYWRSYVAMGLAVIISAAVFLHDQGEREKVSARAVLSNCQQIEAVKGEIRAILERSLAGLPSNAFYREHPEELAKALKNSRDALRRFAPDDCYALPVVRKAGLKPPPRR